MEFVGNILNYNLFPLGEARITPLSLIYLVGFTILLFWASKTHLDPGAQMAIGTISRYVILFLSFLVVLQTVGIDLTTLNILVAIGAIVKVLSKISDLADKMLDDFYYLIYLFPLALIVPILAKSIVDRKTKDI